MSPSLSLRYGFMGALVLFGGGCARSSAPVAAPIAVPYPSSPSSTMSSSLAFPGVRPAADLDKRVRIKTTKGDIVVKIDSALGPNAASNFLYLVEKGFYNGVIFHRVIPGFMIQGGDPDGRGTGGPGYTIPDDAVKLPKGTYEKGTLAMARTGAPNSGGSQFFLMVADVPLNPATYAVFGKIVEGQKVADAIASVPRDRSDKPLEEVKMIEVKID